MDNKYFYASFGFLNESFTLSETEDFEKISLPTARFKQDINMFCSKFEAGFDLWSLIWLYNEACIDQLIPSIWENIWTLVFHIDLTLLGRT